MNPTKKKILELKKGKKHVGINLHDDYKGLQSKLTSKQYICFWRVAAQEVVYIDKGNIITGEMSENVFDTIDSDIIDYVN